MKYYSLLFLLFIRLLVRVVRLFIGCMLRLGIARVASLLVYGGVGLFRLLGLEGLVWFCFFGRGC